MCIWERERDREVGDVGLEIEGKEMRGGVEICMFEEREGDRKVPSGIPYNLQYSPPQGYPVATLVRLCW